MVDATGQALAYVHGHTTQADADAAKGLTLDEARRIASKHRQAADAVIGKANTRGGSAFGICGQLG